MTAIRTVDCRGLACPQPVIDTKEALANATSPIVVIVDSVASATNVRRFAEGQGGRVSLDERGDGFYLTIDPGDGGAAAEPAPPTCQTIGARDLVVLVASEGIGRGDEELGGVLMAAFLDTLSQFKDELSHVILLNAGAKLAVEGSPVLELLCQLEAVGVEVMVCGTCLNHFGINDKLAVGVVSNMLVIIETLSRAGRIIQP